MKILYIADSPMAFLGGCWYHRNHVPAKGLQGRGHEIRLYTINPDMQQEWFDWPDVVVYSRCYPVDPLPQIRKFKQMGKRVMYELDDDLWTVNPENPSVSLSTEKRWQYEHLMAEVDGITTTTEVLAKKIRRFNKNVYICPNCVDFDHYQERFRANPRLQIGYSGAASHWNDLGIIVQPLLDLQAKYDFDFCLQGMVSSPLESEAYTMRQFINLKLQPEKTRYMESTLKLYEKLRGLKYYHIPFYVPYLHSAALRRTDMDIALAPLLDNEFNHAKSCLKYYEYAAVGSATLASDVVPYNKEVSYLAKNNPKDWYKKIERLIVDKKFREELAQKQRKWVLEKRSLPVVAPIWEKAFDTNPIKHEEITIPSGQLPNQN